jgi:putative transposase
MARTIGPVTATSAGAVRRTLLETSGAVV